MEPDEVLRERQLMAKVADLAGQKFIVGITDMEVKYGQVQADGGRCKPMKAL